MPLPLNLKAEDWVLVLVQTDSSFDLPDGALFLPAGTRLVGSWASEQPGDGSDCAVVVGEVLWQFPVTRVTVSFLPEELHPWQEQARIAEESLAHAQQEEQEGHDAEAIRLYARALVELEASGKTPVELSDVRHKRAHLLQKRGDASAALLEFERFARAYEADAFAAGYQYVDRNAVELAAWGYNSMGTIILHKTDYHEGAWKPKLDLVVHHLLSLLKYIARRYNTKVEVLLTSAEIKHALGNKSEAQSLFNQADDLYHQQRLASSPDGHGISLHLARLQETFGGAQRKSGTAPRRTSRKKTPSRKS